MERSVLAIVVVLLTVPLVGSLVTPAWTARAIDSDCLDSLARRGSPHAPDLPGKPRSSQFLVRPVLVVPSDVASGAAWQRNLSIARGAICPAMVEMQAWYEEHTLRTAGVPMTFAFQRPVEILSDQPLSWYTAGGTNADWGRFFSDMHAKGYSGWTPTRVTVGFVVGGGDTALGWYGGTGRNNAQGMALMTDAQLVGAAGSCSAEYWWCGWGGNSAHDMMMGAISHETGHGFGLPHPGGICTTPPLPVQCALQDQRRDSSVMYGWWNWPDRFGTDGSGLNQDEAATLYQNPMFLVDTDPI